MKKRTLKLSLKKQVVSRLNDNTMREVKAGLSPGDVSFNEGPVCNGTRRFPCYSNGPEYCWQLDIPGKHDTTNATCRC